MRAIILCGGKGKRLRPYTTLIPKPLVPLGGEQSILEVVITQLARRGFTRVTLAVSHLSKLIMAYIGDGDRWGIDIDYSLEDIPLNTMGPLTLIDDLPENFLIMNGDILCDIDYGDFLRGHIAEDSRLTVSSYERDTRIDFGVLKRDQDGLLTEFQEKPVYHFSVSMGVYCMHRSVVDTFPVGQPYGFDELMLDCLANQVAVRIKPFDGFWLDIGRPEDYEYAEQNFDSIKRMLGLSQ